MPRMQVTAAALLLAALAASGCARNREVPSELAPSRMTDDRRQQLSVARGARHRFVRPAGAGRCNSGVIITDWYANPNAPGERVKLTVTILDQDLRADALRVAASRQVNQNGAWVDAPVAAATVQKLEDIILTRARDLRRTTVPG